MTPEERIQKLEWRISTLEQLQKADVMTIVNLKADVRKVEDDIRFLIGRISALQDHALEQLKGENDE